MSDLYTLVSGQQTDGTWTHTGKLIVSRRLDNGTLASVTLPDTTGPQGPPGPEGPPGQAAGKIFYYAPSDTSDIATYKTMLGSPSAGAEQTIATPCTGTGDVLVSAFATDPGVPGAVDYPAGTAYRRIYARVSAGTARFHLQVYKRDAGGTETLVRDEFSSNFTDQVVIPQEWTSSASTAGALLATDRIVNKLYAQRVIGPTTVTVTSYYEGAAHTSQIQTTITAGAAGPAGPGVATGGTTGQVLTKNTATNYDTGWTTPFSQTLADARYLQLTGGTVSGSLIQSTYAQQAEIAKPANPSAGFLRVYPKADHKLYILDPAGLETQLGATAANGLPVGGTTGQVLTKTSATDFATNWQTPFSQATADARYLQLAGGILSGALTMGTFTEIPEIATPATPAAGRMRLYAKSDHHLYILDSTGTERMLDITTLAQQTYG